MDAIEIQIVNFNSELQKRSVELRFRVLREPLGLQYTAEQLAEEEEEVHIVALKDQEAAGVVVLKKISEEVLKMRQVAVDPPLQRTGIGKQMVLFSEQYALLNNFKRIELHARDTAKDFYLSLEYEIIGDPFIEVGILHYKMIKILKK